jgi:hypothetical protein
VHALATILALTAALAAPVLPGPQGPGLPGDEGPLDNDCFLPTERTAEEHLARGDQIFAKLTGSENWAADPERAWIEVFESWRAALVESVNGAAVAPRPVGGSADEISPWPDTDGTAERRTEGVEWAVERRLAALAPEIRAKWTERFEPLALEALEAAGNAEPRLAEVERLHPATAAAALAALRLFDLSFEAARPAIGRSWLERCKRHLEQIGAAESGSWPARLAARELALEDWPPYMQGPARAGEPWQSASDLRPLGSSAIAGGRRRGALTPPAPGVGVQPGLCFLEDGTAVIQAPERVVLLESQEGQRVGQFSPAALVEPAGWATDNHPPPATDPPGWPLLPATDGRSIVLVQGHAAGLQRNVLMCVDMEERPEPMSDSSGLRLPRLRWALMHNRRFDGTGTPVISGLGLESPEFQPGPVIVGSQVLVQVRERAEDASLDRMVRRLATATEIRSWVVSLDLGTGRVRWKRFLAKGVPISRSMGRFGSVASPAVSSAQPLGAAGGWLFAGTHIGAGSLLDVADGRLAFTFKNRRRKEDERGWSGTRPVIDRTGEVLLFAPADGDHAYWLRTGKGPGARGPLAFPPRAKGEAVALIGGGAEHALVLSRAGRERTLSDWNARTGGRIDAPYLGPRERFTGHGLASPERVLFATERGLYLLDRQLELFLLDHAPLQIQGDPGPAGGSVFARGDRVYVLGSRTVWIFAAS